MTFCIKWLLVEYYTALGICHNPECVTYFESEWENLVSCIDNEMYSVLEQRLIELPNSHLAFEQFWRS